jgi:hypothetical protein
MNILSPWAYLTTDRGVLSSRGFEITGALMIINHIGWLPKKLKEARPLSGQPSPVIHAERG